MEFFSTHPSTHPPILHSPVATQITRRLTLVVLSREIGHHGAFQVVLCLTYIQRDDEITIILKFRTTSLFLQVVPAETSVRDLKVFMLRALVDSKQPSDENLTRPFTDMGPEDVELFRKENNAYVILAVSSTSAHRAPDGTPLCSACQLADNSVIYVGFREPGEGTCYV